MSEELKNIVRSKYNDIANQSKDQNISSCCGSTSCCDNMDYTIMSDDYSALEGYNTDADLGLGCGLPTEFANISKGDTVVDLGSGAGNDAFVVRSIVGDDGMVLGIDFAGAMLTKAKSNARKLGFKNVKFIKGDIENMPLEDEQADVIISNCVLNLVPDKAKAFSEMFRVIKPGGHFCISDIVLEGTLPSELMQAAEMYAGCVSGAVQKDDYLKIIENAGFNMVLVKKEKEIILPDDILLNYLSVKGLQAYKSNSTGIFSITVVGHKQ
ncbi:MAG: arsenite S-adenosylmethyltransferase [Bacteroidetes bacterium]|nr:MAG: arsenite S-adenosylmethyltransferase [Bacteroidota bacterium]RLD53442.1 MAG: arsenite S-adenosylmethyltransferase [Bacteroidota bacterium]RLD82651.1 MAG: arsenite S-adenosylmethyltransferase [Bacteroidota bacterium]